MANITPLTVIAGTNRENSLTGQLANHYINLLKKKDYLPQLINLLDLPDDFLISALYEKKNDNKVFNTMEQMIFNSQKFIFIVPEYNGSFPGILKVFIDALEFPHSFQHKKAALVGISAGKQGCLLGMSHLTDILSHLSMYVYPLKLSFPSIKILKEITNSLKYNRVIEKQLQTFLAW